MSRRRKHITNEILSNRPEPKDNEDIVRILGTRGTNQIEVEYPNGKKILVMMPTKFKKLVWAKKGDYLIIVTDLSAKNKGKIKGIVQHVLMSSHIRHLKKIGKWPATFKTKDDILKEHLEGTSDNELEQDDSEDKQKETSSTTNASTSQQDDENNNDSEEEEDDDMYPSSNPNRMNVFDQFSDDSSDEDE